MPITYRIDVAKRMVYAEASGVLSRQEIVEQVKAIGSDERYGPSFSSLADYSKVTELQLTTADVKAIASASPQGSRRAVVMPTDLLYGMARMYEVFAAEAGTDVRAFRTLAEAEEWLADQD
jgi:hypothetical protein